MRDVGVGRKRECSSLEHERGEVAHDRLCLQVQVPEHFVGTPTTEEADNVRIHLRAEQGHSPRGSKAAGADIGRVNAQRSWAKGNDGGAKCIRNVGGGDAAPNAIAPIGREGRVKGRVVKT